MNDTQTLDALQGRGENLLHFEEIDQRFQLKIRALIKLCMPPIFKQLEQEMNVGEMRRGGIAPIMFFLQFRTEPRALAFNGRVETPFKVRLHRANMPPTERGLPAPRKSERLLLDMHIDVEAQAGTGSPLEIDAPGGELVRAGYMRGVHVLTRPLAPPGERQVTEVPPQLERLAEHPFDEPYPTLELLRTVDEGYRERESGPWWEHRSVWGLNNTDINQHVNVQEYIRGMENQFTRLLFGTNLPVERHHITDASFLFRRPFFLGQPYGIRGRLWLNGDRTMMQAGVHRVAPEGGLDPVPSVFARMEGRIAEPG